MNKGNAIAPGVIPYYGGKTRQRGAILPLLRCASGGPGTIYLEPFGGSAAILLARPPVPIEIYNDIDGDLVNLMRCLQGREWTDLQHRLEATLHSRAEYRLAIQTLNSDADPVDRAWAYFVAMTQGISGVPGVRGSWSRSTNQSSGMSMSVAKWWARIGWLNWWHERLALVTVECCDALDLIVRYGPEAKRGEALNTVIYADPPYVPATRQTKSVYTHELADHAHLLTALIAASEAGATVVLSGYDCPEYRTLDDAGWSRIEFANTSRVSTQHSDMPRTEAVWTNTGGSDA